MDLVVKLPARLLILLLAASFFALAAAGECFADEIHRPKVAVVLSGGGMKAAAAIGVLKALEEEEIPVDMIVGSSMGAVVGGLYAAGMTPEHIQDQFEKKKLLHAYLTIPLSLRILVIPLFYTPRLVGIEPYDGLYRGKRFADYLNKQIPETQRSIEDLKVPFGAIAVNLLDGKVKVFNSGNLSTALQASCAIPALRKPVKIKGDDGLYVDGSVLNNLPVKEARKMGADIVIAVDTTDRGETKDSDYHKVGSVTARVINLHMAQVDRESRLSADFVIDPSVQSVPAVSTSPAQARKLIEAGAKAAHQVAPAIKDCIEKHTVR